MPRPPLALLLVACTAANASAFTSPAFSAAHPTHAKAVSKRAAPVAHAVPVEALKAALALPTMYALMSGNEYFTHRYYQHAEYNKDTFFQVGARRGLESRCFYVMADVAIGGRPYHLA